MDVTAFDDERILNNFLTKYIDDELNKAEKASFEEYLSQNPREKKFARRVLGGKRALGRLAQHFNKVSAKA